MSDWNTNIIDEFRANEGRVGGQFEGAPLVLLHHHGRKSGREYVNPVMSLPTAGANPPIRRVFADPVKACGRMGLAVSLRLLRERARSRSAGSLPGGDQRGYSRATNPRSPVSPTKRSRRSPGFPRLPRKQTGGRFSPYPYAIDGGS